MTNEKEIHTLRTVWELKGFRNVDEVAVAAHVSKPIVYRMLHKQEVKSYVHFKAVLDALDITPDMYSLLEAE